MSKQFRNVDLTQNLEIEVFYIIFGLFFITHCLRINVKNISVKNAFKKGVQKCLK